jgi:PAS domain-containing protein
VITILDADGTIRYQTPSVEDLLGRAPETLAGTPLLELLHPDRRQPSARARDRRAGPLVGLRTVAEGIERREEVAPLLELACDLAQGYQFTRPTSAAEVAALAGGPQLNLRRGVAAPRGATRAS